MRIVTGILIVAGLVVPARAITLGQVDTFSGGPANWFGGSPYEVVASGGPTGHGDAFLRNSSGAQQRLRLSNMDQWAGDYLTAGVRAVELDLVNLGGSDLEIKLFLYGGRQGTFTSVDPIALPPDGQWRHVVFSLTTNSLAHLEGTAPGDLAVALQDVQGFGFWHHRDLESDGTPVIGEFGVDNVRAIPEPVSAISLMCVALLVVTRRSR